MLIGFKYDMPLVFRIIINNSEIIILILLALTYSYPYTAALKIIAPLAIAKFKAAKF